jgi:anti-sigma regulatory factor (Ser/Thr protein kinase)
VSQGTLSEGLGADRTWARQPQANASFRHEALLYSGEPAFVSAVSPFLRHALAAEEAALVVVSENKIKALRDELGDDARHIQFVNMDEVGVNPARIIPLWQRFVERYAPPGTAVRGIGEPIWPDRSAAELVECQRHERLLNLAFTDSRDFWLLCPYDTTSLAASVIEEAQHSHPYVAGRSTEHSSNEYAGTPPPSAPHSDPLPAAPSEADSLTFDNGTLEAVRRFVAVHPLVSELAGERAGEFVLAVNEVVTNSVVHGGGRGALSLWRDGSSLVCEVRDGGHIDWALVGRVAPATDSESGRGLWMVNQLCDLVQIRSFPEGNVVRLHLRSPERDR